MQYGDIIELGRHRLMCGDATNPNDIAALIDGRKVDLVLTDPPYGNRDIQKANGVIGADRGTWLRPSEGRRFYHYVEPKKYAQIIGNDSTDAAREHYEVVKEIAKRQIIWGGNYFADFLPVSRGWLFWDKRTGKSDFGDGELAWTNVCNKVKLYSHLWSGCFREGSWLLNYGGGRGHGNNGRFHPTQKPVELHMHILEDFSHEGDVILDCFGGSGTTLIACEVTGRTCLMMELSPEYCNVIVNRFSKLCGDSLGL